MTIKPILTKRPRIRRLGKGDWQCACTDVARRGKSWRHAWDRWIVAAVRHAINRPRKNPGAQTIGFAPLVPLKAAPLARKVKLRRKAGGIRVHRIEDQRSPSPAARAGEGKLSQKRQKPTIEPYQGEVVRAAQPSVRPAYRLPASLALLAARSKCQPRLISISQSSYPESNV